MKKKKGGKDDVVGCENMGRIALFSVLLNTLFGDSFCCTAVGGMCKVEYSGVVEGGVVR